MWHDELDDWLRGGVLSEESVRYINNFMSVYRVRPHDVSEDVVSDEDSSDEELVLTKKDLARAMQTRIGGREAKNSEKKKTSASGKVSHEENSRTGINLVQKIWPVDENVTYKDSKVQHIDHTCMKRSLLAARQPQRQVHDVSVTGSVSGYGQNIQLYKNAN